MSAAVTTRPTTVTPTGPRPALLEPAGRHRRETTPRSRLTRAVNVVSRVGSLVTLSALIVLAATAGGLADGMPATGSAVTVTFDGGANP